MFLFKIPKYYRNIYIKVIEYKFHNVSSLNNTFSLYDVDTGIYRDEGFIEEED